MNVIWIISDTLRRDAIGVYGNKIVRTPAIDELANRSMRFNRHYAAGFPTMPTRADFATGRWTMSFMDWEPLPADQVTLPQLLSAAGVHTAAFVDTPFYIGEGMNYERGFETFFFIAGQLGRGYGRELRSQWRSELDRFAPRTFLTATQWLERHHKEDFFICIDTWDPHEPFEAPDYYTELYWPGYDGENIYPPYARWQDVLGFTEEKVKKARACYWGEVTMVDTWVGYLLRQLENMALLDNTAIIFTSDHGFHFGEHGGLFGKSVAYIGPDEKLVPLTPGQKAAPVPEDEVWVPAPYRVRKLGAGGEITGERTGGWVDSPLYEEIANIPLFIYVPGVPPGICDGLTSAVDLMPTVLDIMGQRIPPFVEGRSLLPMVKDPSVAGREFVITTEPFANPGERTHIVNGIGRPLMKAPMTTITTGEWSLLYNIEPGRSELYHLPSDPGQEMNVIAERPDVARDLHRKLVDFMTETAVKPERIELRRELKL